MTVFLYYLRLDAEPENGGLRRSAQRRANAGLMLTLTAESTEEKDRSENKGKVADL